MSTPDTPGTTATTRRGATGDVRAALVPLWRGQVVFRVVALAYAVAIPAKRSSRASTRVPDPTCRR
jgi:hypothetical protein